MKISMTSAICQNEDDLPGENTVFSSGLTKQADIGKVGAQAWVKLVQKLLKSGNTPRANAIMRQVGTASRQGQISGVQRRTISQIAKKSPRTGKYTPPGAFAQSAGSVINPYAKPGGPVTEFAKFYKKGPNKDVLGTNMWKDFKGPSANRATMDAYGLRGTSTDTFRGGMKSALQEQRNLRLANKLKATFPKDIAKSVDIPKARGIVQGSKYRTEGVLGKERLNLNDSLLQARMKRDPMYRARVERALRRPASDHARLPMGKQTLMSGKAGRMKGQDIVPDSSVKDVERIRRAFARRGLVHPDMHSGNVMFLDPAGKLLKRPQVIDWGWVMKNPNQSAHLRARLKLQGIHPNPAKPILLGAPKPGSAGGKGVKVPVNVFGRTATRQPAPVERATTVKERFRFGRGRAYEERLRQMHLENRKSIGSVKTGEAIKLASAMWKLLVGGGRLGARSLSRLSRMNIAPQVLPALPKRLAKFKSLKATGVAPRVAARTAGQPIATPFQSLLNPQKYVAGLKRGNQALMKRWGIKPAAAKVAPDIAKRLSLFKGYKKGGWPAREAVREAGKSRSIGPYADWYSPKTGLYNPQGGYVTLGNRYAPRGEPMVNLAGRQTVGTHGNLLTTSSQRISPRYFNKDVIATKVERQADPTLALRHEIDEVIAGRKASQRIGQRVDTPGYSFPGKSGHIRPKILQDEARHLNFMPQGTQDRWLSMRSRSGEADHMMDAFMQVSRDATSRAGRQRGIGRGISREAVSEIDKINRIAGGRPMGPNSQISEKAWYRMINHPNPKIRSDIEKVLWRHRNPEYAQWAESVGII